MAHEHEASNPHVSETQTTTVVDPTRTTDHEEIVTDADRGPLLSWGAIIAGLFVLVATSWLLYLLGLAFGVSVADACDGDAIGDGLGTGVVVWMLISSLAAYFLGSLLAARVSGKTDSTVGMLHGLTLWGVATTLMIVLSYIGVTNLLQTGYSVAKSTASTVTSAVTATVGQTVDAAQSVSGAMDSELADNIQARLKRRASSVIARAEAAGGPEVSPEEVREAIENVDTRTMIEIAEHVALGESRSAREKLAEATNLSSEEVRDIVNGVANEFEQQLGTADNDTALVDDISRSLQRQTADLVADLDAPGGAEVTSSEIQTALSQLTPATMQRVATRLIQGNTQGAKDVLTANTTLTSRQVNDIVEGVDEDVSRTIQ
ncbi:MAG: hypothetical protein ACF788_10440, partial [Novipirellula sp. JB048]